MKLEHNEEVQLMAPLQMWGRHRGVGLGAEEGHQDGPETQRVPGRATKQPVPSSASAARALAELRSPGTAARPGSADGRGQDRHTRGGEGAVRTRNSTAERLRNVEMPRPWFCAHAMIKREEKARTHTEQAATCSVP